MSEWTEDNGALWRVEQPRARTIMYCGVPKRVVFPSPIVFMCPKPRVRHATLSAWSVEEFSLDAELRVSPFTDVDDDHTHVYASGAVCMDSAAHEAIKKGRDPVDVFWSSGFTRLPAWGRRRDSTLVAPAASQCPRAFVEHAFCHDDLADRTEKPIRVSDAIKYWQAIW